MASNSELNKAQPESGLGTMEAEKPESVAQILEPPKSFDLFMDNVRRINDFLHKGEVYQKSNPDYDKALVQLDLYAFLIDLCQELLTSTKDNRPSERAWFLLEEVQKVLKAVDQDLHLSSNLRPVYNNWCKFKGIKPKPQPQPDNSGGSGSPDSPPKRTKYQRMSTSEGENSKGENSKGENSKGEDAEGEEGPNSKDQESESNNDSGESSDKEASTNLAVKKEIQVTYRDQQRVFKLVHGSPSQVLVSKFRLQINRTDICSLYGSNCLNDNVINFYMELLNQRAEQHVGQLPRVYAMNTFFLPRLYNGYPAVRRWTRNIDIFSKEIIAVPVHSGGGSNHWTLAIIHMRDKAIRHYDSMGGSNNRVLQSLTKYLHQESLDKRKQPFDFSGFKIENVQNVPQQNNCNDCGVFICTFAEYITRDAPLTFGQEDMNCLREKMILEIVDGQLRS